jgi:integrase
MRYSLDAEVNGFCGARSRSVIGSGLARRHRTCRTIVGDGPRHGETAAKHPISAGRSRHYRARKAKRYATQRGRRRAAERYQEELGRSCPDVLRRIRVHDLKHTFGDRIRAAGVSFKDRQTLLGHKAHHVMTHYSAAPDFIRREGVRFGLRQFAALSIVRAGRAFASA